MQREKRLAFSVSATSRPQRRGEVHGHDYYFISAGEFTDRIHSGDFIEWEEVYDGCYYGTLKNEVQRIWEQGKVILFDVDVKGGINLKKYFGDKSISFFIKVMDIRILEERLLNRKTESPESLRTRLEKSKYEMSFEEEFDYSAVNDDLQKCCDEVYGRILEFLTT
jgi:guanylate kinase